MATHKGASWNALYHWAFWPDSLHTVLVFIFLILLFILHIRFWYFGPNNPLPALSGVSDKPWRLLMIGNVCLWSEFQHRSIKSLLFNCGVGVGMATFSGLYSSVLHLYFILALPSTSSDRHVYLTVCLSAICREAFWQGGGVRRIPASRARRRREQPLWENVCLRAFHSAT